MLENAALLSLDVVELAVYGGPFADLGWLTALPLRQALPGVSALRLIAVGTAPEAGSKPLFFLAGAGDDGDVSVGQLAGPDLGRRAALIGRSGPALLID